MCYLVTFFAAGNRLNHNHFAHHATLHRRPPASEFIQFRLVPIVDIHIDLETLGDPLGKNRAHLVLDSNVRVDTSFWKCWEG